MAKINDTKLELMTDDNDNSNKVAIKLYKDGAVSLSADGAENFIYLYPSQVKKLKAALEISGDVL